MNTSSVDPQIRPWVRFWARQLDYSFGGLILAVLDTFLLEVNDTAFPFIVIFAWVFVESWLLSAWGTTPGKFLLRVSVRTPDGRCPSFSTALKRSFLVWLRGTGMGIPIVNLITAKHAYDILTKQRHTTWDHDTKLVVTHKIIGANQIILTIAYAIGILFLIILVST